jgi:hypothetical protein
MTAEVRVSQVPVLTEFDIQRVAVSQMAVLLELDKVQVCVSQEALLLLRYFPVLLMSLW